MPNPTKKTAAAKPADEAEPLENMPTPPAKKATKQEFLFVAWTGEIVGLENPPAEVIVRDLQVFGRKADCTEFAVDQDPAWKWVQTSKGESLKDAILAKASGR